MGRKMILCKPNGFCAGVDRAVAMVELALKAYGAPVFINHEIVHNQHVIQRLVDKGAVFVDDISVVPSGGLLIFSAHGVPPALRDHADRLQLKQLDATCPLVTRVHLDALNFIRKGYHVLLIGHESHVEVQGTFGEAPQAITIVEPRRGDALKDHIASIAEPSSEKLVFLTQTTLNVDDCLEVVAQLRCRWPHLQAPSTDSICYATTNRQNAVKAVTAMVDFFVVVGSPSSSNSKRLVEVAQESGCDADLFDNVSQLELLDLGAFQTVGITAGASSPQALINEIILFLKGKGFDRLETVDHVVEDQVFLMPRQFRNFLDTKGISV